MILQQKLERCDKKLRTSQIPPSLLVGRVIKEMPESLVEGLAIFLISQKWHDHSGAMFGLL